MDVAADERRALATCCSAPGMQPPPPPPPLSLRVRLDFSPWLARSLVCCRLIVAATNRPERAPGVARRLLRRRRRASQSIGQRQQAD